MKKTSDILSDNIGSYLTGHCTLSEAVDKICDELETLIKKDCLQESISKLKNKIKHTKNPLELKMLNKQLNELYKAKKGR